MSIAAHSEEIYKPYEITNVLNTFFFFDTYEEMIVSWNDDNPDDYEDPLDKNRLQGWSNCECYPERNFSHCDVYIVRPSKVDDEHTLTVGHEVLHGVYGPGYHDNFTLDFN